MSKEHSKAELAFASQVNTVLNGFFKQCYPEAARKRTIYGIPGEKGNGKRKGKDWTDAVCVEPNDNDTCKAFFNRTYTIEKMALQVPMIMVRFGIGVVVQDPKKDRKIFKLPTGAGSAGEVKRVTAKWEGSKAREKFLSLTWIPCPTRGAEKKSMPSGACTLNGAAARVPFAALETQPAFMAALDKVRELANQASDEVTLERTSVPEGAADQDITFTVSMTPDQLQAMLVKIVEVEQHNAILEGKTKQVAQAIADSADKGTGVVTELAIAS